MKSIEGIYLLLGTNLGERKENLAQALQQITAEVSPVDEVSSLYESEAWGVTKQPLFLNRVVTISKRLPPVTLLHKLQAVEQQMGRVRYRKWGERIIDIDILYYFDEIIQTEELQVPHPGIPHRRFTLVPLCELAAEAEHPVLHQSHQELLQLCTDPLKVWRWEDAF